MALVLATFTILFGTRHLDASERHEGLVAAIAFESLVKLVAFLAVGVFVTWGIYHGLADVFARAAAHAKLARLFAPLDGAAGSYASWAWLTVLSMLAIMFLPRQFQIAVVENVNENHLGKAIWLFPLYMLAMNLFVVPIAFGGVMHLAAAGADPDTFVLTLPMAEKQEALALLVFIGGLSAATGMVIVETIALSTMVCNDLVMPVLLRMRSMRLAEQKNLTGCCSGSAAARSSRSCCSGTSTTASPAKRTRWWRSGSSRSPRSRSSRRRSSAASTGRAPPARERSRASARASPSGSTRCSCRPSPSPDGCPSAS